MSRNGRRRDRIVLGPGVEDDTADEPGRGAPRATVIAVVLAIVAALVVVALVVGRDRGGDDATPDSTTAPTVPVTSTTKVATTEPTAPTTTTSVAATAVTLPFGTETGLVLALTPDGGAPTRIVLYDVDRAEYHEIGLRDDVGWYVRTVDGAGGLVLDGGRLLRIARGAVTVLDEDGTFGFDAAPYGRVASGPDGGVWIRRLEAADVVLVAADGSMGASHPLPIGADLYGSTETGRPVVRGRDGRLLVIGEDGGRSAYAANATGPVGHGRFAEIVCDDVPTCHVVGHIGTATVDLGPDVNATGSPIQFVFEPDGSHVAVVDGARIRLIDSASGSAVDAIGDLTVVANGFSTAPPVRFLPGGFGLAVTTESGIVLVDLAGRVVTTIDPGAGQRAGPVLLGIGRTPAWA